jgi:hypothetical protein
MKIANIVYENELVNHVNVDYVNYYKGNFEYDSLDKTLPTLYVGWSFMKACNHNNDIIKNADVLDKRIISNELYWECSFNENKPSHINGIESFINLVPQYYFVPKYHYINLDPVFFQIKDIQDLMDVLPKTIDFLYNYKNEMIYILSGNHITGLNLGMYSFFKFDILEIRMALSKRTTDLFEDINGIKYQSYYKIFPNFTYLKRYIIDLIKKDYE